MPARTEEQEAVDHEVSDLHYEKTDRQRAPAGAAGGADAALTAIATH